MCYHQCKSTVLKVLVAGDGGVGKTSLIRRYVLGCFDSAERITIGCDFYTKVLNTEDGHQYKFQIWDMGGQEQFRVLLPLWSKGLRGAVLTFDVGSIESYLHLDEWLAMISDGEQTKRFPIVIVGNKSDRANGSIRDSDLVNYVTKRGLGGYYFVSAKDNLSIPAPFLGLLKLITSGEIADGGSENGNK
nr:Rab family GTPase [Candidatus Njordarchaeum guaymaensis]